MVLLLLIDLFTTRLRLRERLSTKQSVANPQKKHLDLMNGGVKSYPIDKVRMDACSLQTRFIDELVQLQDCSRKKCRIKKLPKGLNALNALKYLRQVPIWKLYKIGRKYMKNARVGKL
jgi:hypothetical protein